MGGEIAKVAETQSSCARAILRMVRQPYFDEELERATEEEQNALMFAAIRSVEHEFREILERIRRRELVDRSLHDLRIMAKSLGVKKWSRLTKLELVESIRRVMNEKR